MKSFISLDPDKHTHTASYTRTKQLEMLQNEEKYRQCK